MPAIDCNEFCKVALRPTKTVSESKKNVKTMADIARIAGVSASTVSRALDDSPLVSAKTKEHVQAIAKDYAYRPHLGARNFRLKESNIIVLVLPFYYSDDDDQDVLANPYIFKVIGNLGAVLRKYGYDLLISQMSDITTKIDDRYIHSGVADGVIILGRGDNTPEKILSLVERNIPFIVMGPTHVDQGYCSVGIDNIVGSRNAVEHLAQLGRRRIAIISDNFTDEFAEATLRYRGYRQALEQAGLPFDESLTALSTYSGQSGYEAARSLLQTTPDLDAIFVATSDIVAIGAMQALREAGRRIPHDVAIIGFDNIDLCNFTTPPLTSVSQRLSDGGVQIVVDKLRLLIDGQETDSIMLDGDLVIRESCGAEL